jgi:hypothetical protein
MTAMPAQDFTGWTLDRLTAQRRHLESLLAVSAGQGDPERPWLRAEHAAVTAEISGRQSGNQPPCGADGPELT